MRLFHAFFLTCVCFIAGSASSAVEPSTNEVKPRSLFHSWWNPWSIFPIRGPRGESDISSSHTSANTLGGASKGHLGIGFTIDYGKNTEAGASHASSGIAAEESILASHPAPDDLTQTGSDVPSKIKDTSNANLNHDLAHTPIIILDASTLLSSKVRDNFHQPGAGENVHQTTPSIHQTAYHAINKKQDENVADDLTSAPKNQLQINDSKVNLLIGLSSDNKDFRATPETVSESRVNFSSGNVMFEVQTKNHSAAQSTGQAKESIGNYVAQKSNTGKVDSLETIYAALSDLAQAGDHTTPQFSSVSRSFVERSSNSASTNTDGSSSTDATNSVNVQIKDSSETQNLTKFNQTDQNQVTTQLKDGEDESSNRIFESTPSVSPFKRDSPSQSSILTESSIGNTNIQGSENAQTGLRTPGTKDQETPKIEISSIQPITGKPQTGIPSIQPTQFKPQPAVSAHQPNTGKLQTEISAIQPITGKPQLSSAQSTTDKGTSHVTALPNSHNMDKIPGPPSGLPWLRTHYYPVQANFWYPHNGPYHSYTTEYGPPPPQEYGPPQPQPQVYFTNDLYSATDGYNVAEPYYSPYKPPPKPIFTAAEYNNDHTTYYSAYRPATKPVYLTKGTTPYRGVTIYLESDPDTTTQTPSTIYSANAVTTEKPSINSWFRPPQFLTNIISVLNKDNVGKPRDKVTPKPPTSDQKSA